MIKLMVLFVALASCQNKTLDENNIVGEWKVTEFINSTVDISPSLIKEAKNIALSTTYVFKDDNTFSMNSSFENINGTWDYNAEDNIIIMIYNSQYKDNVKDEQQISNFHQNKMTWKHTYGEFGYTEMVLSKK